MIRSFLFGFTLPIRSLRTIFTHPKLIFWSAIPVAITFTLYLLFFNKLETLLKGLMAAGLIAIGVLQKGVPEPTWLSVILYIFLGVIAVLTFSSLTSLISIPFNDFLAESTEPYAHPPLAPVLEKGLARQLRIFAIDAMKSIFATTLTLISLVMLWIPVINLAASLLGLWLLAFQFISYPQTRRGQGVLLGLKFLSQHPFSTLGFGLAHAILFSIPFLGSLTLPLAVVGGTLLFAREEAR